MKGARPKQGKSLEEFFAKAAIKMPAHNSQRGASGNERSKPAPPQRDYTNFIMAPPKPEPQQASGMVTYRHKTVYITPKKSERAVISDKNPPSDPYKKENMKALQRGEKHLRKPAPTPNANSNLPSPKVFINYESEPAKTSRDLRHDKQRLHQQQLYAEKQRSDAAAVAAATANTVHDQPMSEESEDEFFGVIRNTVDVAVNRAICKIINPGLHAINQKVDMMREELRENKKIFLQIEEAMNKKIEHCGEENARHFCYLCMKSEYDKMFYQQHIMMGNGPPPPPAFPPRGPCANECKRMNHNSGGDGKSSSRAKEQGSLSNKSSEINMREVLDYIKKFCMDTTGQPLPSNPDVEEDGETSPGPQEKQTFRLEDVMHMKKHLFEEDSCQMSSDGNSARSADNGNGIPKRKNKNGNNARGGTSSHAHAHAHSSGPRTDSGDTVSSGAGDA